MKQIKLYIMSLWILFVLVLVATLNIPVSFDSNATFVGWKMLLSINNVVAFLCILFILMGLLFYYQFNYRLKGAPDGLPIMITKIENINYEYVSLFMTLLSVIAFDFNTFRGAILFFFSSTYFRCNIYKDRIVLFKSIICSFRVLYLSSRNRTHGYNI